MNKILCCLLLGTVLYSSYDYNGSTVAPVTLAGGIIKAHNTEVVKKYKRKDCPVCKGKGWYISGDGIAKVQCGYCEPEVGVTEKTPPQSHPRTLIRHK